MWRVILAAAAGFPFRPTNGNLFLINQIGNFHNFCFAIPRKNRKIGTLFMISYIRNVAITEINTINENCPATPMGNFKTKKLATIKIGIWRM